MSFRGRLFALVASSICLVVWVVKPSRFAAAVPEGKSRVRREARLRMADGLGRLFPNAVSRVR
jgi:hypothetical protein